MRKFAVFDIDGTLIRWQLYHAVVDRLAKNGTLGEGAHEIIREARMKWKRREGNDGFAEYESVMIELFDRAVSRLDPTDFDAMVNSVIEEYKDQTYTYTRDLIKKLQKDGYLLLAISGSQKELVEKIAKHYEFDDFIATEYRRKAGKFSGEVTVASHDKKAALNSLVQKHNLSFEDSYAVGDSKSDGAMLEMVEHPIAFNPDQNLYKIAIRNGWKIVVERKNVIYELGKVGEKYELHNE